MSTNPPWQATRYLQQSGTDAAIVTGHPAATAAAAHILNKGGNAVDGAIAAAAVLNVVRPHMCGVGGDGFLLIFDSASEKVHALNAGGPVPAGIDPGTLGDQIPKLGAAVSSVPGIVDGWGQAHERFGALSREEVLGSAIDFADRGIPVYESLARWLQHYETKYAADSGCAAAFMPQGRPPRRGELLVQKDLARTLSRLAQKGWREFYEGEFAQIFHKFMAENGGYVTAADLKDYRAIWRQPLAMPYRNHMVYTQPPMSQGWMLLQMLGVLGRTEWQASGFDSGERITRLAGAVGHAFDDRERCFGDPTQTGFTLDQVLSETRIANIAQAVGRPIAPATPWDGGDTTSLAIVDRQGNAVSMIQSLWIDAGVMVPDTGVLLNARLNSCTLKPGHPNVLIPGKMPVYTMHTYIVCHNGRPVIVGGTPGGNSQVQTNLQVITNILDRGMTAQEAVEAPRVAAGGALQLGNTSMVSIEGRYPETVVAALKGAGYGVHVLPDWASLELEGYEPVTVGSAKIVHIDPATGVRATGVDPRRDAHGLAW